MPGLIHATAASGWSLSGSILTFAMPMLLFIAAATVLYLLFSRPHQVPGHRVLAPAQAAQAAQAARAAPPDAGRAHAAAPDTAAPDTAAPDTRARGAQEAGAQEAGPEAAE